jgi:steroid 5-alpha reductase family enzyme
MDSIYLMLYGLCIALIITLIGFRKVVWFISIGYTLSIVALCAGLLIYHYPNLELFNWLQIVILGLWGLRLGSFLIKREFNANYNKSVKDQTDSSQGQSFMMKVLIWAGVSVLYVMMFSPSIFALQTVRLFDGFYEWIAYSGVLIMILGLGIESLADQQKSKFKEKNPRSYCDVGLYQWVRCPNYLGEMMIWTGHLIVAIPFLSSWWQVLIALGGWICIILIMMGSTKRLEKKQKERYGDDPKFQEYIKSVPVLFPWLPIYSLEKVQVYLE